MKTSVIRHRVADFLKAHAPFDALREPDLLELAGSGRVKFHESDEYVYRQGDSKGTDVWIIQQGRVELVEEGSSREQLRDVLGEGDLLGLDRFAGEGNCQCSARTTSDVILYGISAAAFEVLVPRYPEVKRYVTAHASVSGILGFGRSSWLDAEPPPLEFLRARHPFPRPCSSIVTAPVSIRIAVREMLSGRTEELTVAADGAPDTILTASELALFCGHNPMRLDLTLHLNDDGAFRGMPLPTGFSLDGLCGMFGVVPHDRHTAGGDAFITAQIFLRLLRAAKAVGRTTLDSLCVPYQPH